MNYQNKIKNVTRQMLFDIRAEKGRMENRRVSDKELAEELEINHVTFSRLYTEVCKPTLLVWAKINNLHKRYCGKERNNIILEELFEPCDI